MKTAAYSNPALQFPVSTEYASMKREPASSALILALPVLASAKCDSLQMRACTRMRQTRQHCVIQQTLVISLRALHVGSLPGSRDDGGGPAARPLVGAQCCSYATGGPSAVG